MINLTNFPASPAQEAQGVVNMSNEDRSAVRELLTFNRIPSAEERQERVEKVADIAEKYGEKEAMIGGAPYILSDLESELSSRGIEPCYSFSERISVDRQNPDGSVTKTSVFEHKDFVRVQDVIMDKSDNKVQVDPGKENSIINLTQHDATPAQVKDGVVEPQDKGAIRAELTFTGAATPEDIKEKANAIADKAVESGCGKAMIGGAGYLMSSLETALSERGIQPVYAFSERNTVVKENPDGTTSKQTVFEHKGFVSDISPIPAGEAVDKDKDDVDKGENDDRQDVSRDVEDEDAQGVENVDTLDDENEDNVATEDADDIDAGDFDDNDYDYDPVD